MTHWQYQSNCNRYLVLHFVNALELSVELSHSGGTLLKTDLEYLFLCQGHYFTEGSFFFFGSTDYDVEKKTIEICTIETNKKSVQRKENGEGMKDKD